MRKTGSKQLNVVYEFVSLDPAAGKELEGGFGVLFDIVLKEIEAEVLMKHKVFRPERIFSVSGVTLDN